MVKPHQNGTKIYKILKFIYLHYYYTNTNNILFI